MSHISGGTLLRNPREGFRSEYLAFYAFSAFGPTVEYRSENDFGLDLICNLTDVQGHYLNVKATYGVQIKSDGYSFKYTGENFFDWYWHLEYPFLLCTVSKGTTNIKIYSTWNLMRLYMKTNPNEHCKLPNEVTFVLDGQYDELPEPDFEKGTVPVGNPILEFDIVDLGEKKNIAQFKEILDEWIEMDRKNHLNKRSCAWFATGFTKWETNKSLRDTSRLWRSAYQFSPFSYDQSKSQIAQNAVIVALYIQSKIGMATDLETKNQYGNELKALKDYLFNHCSAHIDTFSREVFDIDE